MDSDDLQLAVNLVLTHVLDELSKADPKLAIAIRRGFDKATDAAEAFALQQPKTLEGRTGSTVLSLVERLRRITFGESSPSADPPSGDAP